MGTEKLAQVVAKTAKSANCIIMNNHGAITVGKSLLEAFDRLEVLETCAKMTLISEGFLKKKIRLLDDGELLDIDRLMGRA